MRQIEIVLEPKPKGFHLITRELLQKVGPLPDKGILHLFIKHTSAGLTINENADPDVLKDMDSVLNKLVPENLPFLLHTMEGPDDMPAHVKASLMGQSVSIPITNGRLNLGTWQGICLGEFRYDGGARRLVATVVE